MGNNKVNYKVSKKIVIILTTLFIGGIVYINNSDAIQVKQVVSKSNAQTQSLEEQHQKIKELEEELAKEKSKNTESNFMSTIANNSFQGEYISSSDDTPYTFELDFEENLIAKLKIRCLYESNEEIEKIAFPLQKMRISETNSEQGYVSLEGIQISTPEAYNKENTKIPENNVKFSIIKDKAIDTFDMKIWIKDGEINGFFFDKEQREFARISGTKKEQEKSTNTLDTNTK